MDPVTAVAVASGPPSAAKQPSLNSDQNTFSPNPNPTPVAISISIPNPNTKSSRWTDGPQSGDPTSASEPPHKKVRNDESIPIYGSSATAGYGDASAYSASSSAAVTTTTTTSYGYGETGYANNTAGYQSYAPTQYQAPSNPGSFAPGSAKGTGALFYKTKLCTKFKIGTCTFNERCHFAHGTEDLRKPPPHWETLVGTVAATTGTGTYSNAAGQVTTRAKTRQCRYFAEGNCPYGERCNFLHGNEEVQKASGYSMAAPTVAPVSSAHYQGYGAASVYPNGGNVQYSNSNQMPNMYGDSSASTVAPSYGASTAPSVTAYSSIPPAANPYPTSQDVANGGTVNYNYWNMPGQAPNSMPAYAPANPAATQNNQTTSWMHNYGATGAPVPQYSQEQTQTVNPVPYGSQTAQPAGTTHTESGYYPATYGQATYPNQQPDYAARYNMAEAWGGKVQ